ncbi:hypothetical protein RIR_jg11579.t1 [Rhizophagus irregularis DAOM 181602=DAOM 197198]|nr:hypothetical protein RIR_jg11579.t1 [Rhizophagus irregularis DAOM 181602=DAOM 197198]
MSKINKPLGSIGIYHKKFFTFFIILTPCLPQPNSRNPSVKDKIIMVVLMSWSGVLGTGYYGISMKE